MSEREDIMYTSTALCICTFVEYILHAYFADTFFEVFDH